MSNRSLGTVQGAVATWPFVNCLFEENQVATAPCTVPADVPISPVPIYNQSANLGSARGSRAGCDDRLIKIFSTRAACAPSREVTVLIIGNQSSPYRKDSALGSLRHQHKHLSSSSIPSGLFGTSLDDASLEGTILYSAELYAPDIGDASLPKGLTWEQLSQAKLDDSTILPPEFAKRWQEEKLKQQQQSPSQ